MIIKDNNVSESKKLSGNYTVGKFVNEVMLKKKDVDKKYFAITLRESIGGYQNMILYMQNGVVKSHHSSYGKFDYRKYLDYEIFPHYNESYIRFENIKCFDFECEEDLINDINFIYKKEDCMIHLESKEERIHRALDEDYIKNKVLREGFKDVELLKVIKILVSDNKEKGLEIDKLRSEVDKVEKRLEELNDRVKWLAR
ncbi:MAG: hypothetical protein ACLR60_03640 [Clostridium paraputrificum]